MTVLVTAQFRHSPRLPGNGVLEAATAISDVGPVSARAIDKRGIQGLIHLFLAGRKSRAGLPANSANPVSGFTAVASLDPDRETMLYDPVGQQIFYPTAGQSLRVQ